MPPRENPFDTYPTIFEAAKRADAWYHHHFSIKYPGLFNEETKTVNIGLIDHEHESITSGRSDKDQFRRWFQSGFSTMVRDWRREHEDEILRWMAHVYDAGMLED